MTFGYSQPAPTTQPTKEYTPSPGGWDFQKLRPLVKSQKFNNDLLFMLYHPSLMRMFQGVVGPEVCTWWMKLPMHFVSSDVNGKKFTQQVLCKKAANSFYEEHYKSPLVFQAMTCSCGAKNQAFRCCVACGADLGPRNRDSECPEDEKAQQAWSEYNNAWAEIFGGDAKKRYALKRDNEAQYKEYCKAGTKVRHWQDIASNYSPKDRYLFETFDLGKLLGSRPLDEEEPSDHRVLPLMQGEKIYKALVAKHEARKAFYDPRSKLAIRVSKDTKDGLQYAKYDIEDVGMPEVPDAWVAYLLDYLENRTAGVVPDFSDKVTVLPYEEHAVKAGLTATREISAPMSTPAAPSVSVSVPSVPNNPPAPPAPIQASLPATASAALPPAPPAPPAPPMPSTQAPVRTGMSAPPAPPSPGIVIPGPAPVVTSGPPAPPSPPSMPTDRNSRSW